MIILIGNVSTIMIVCGSKYSTHLNSFNSHNFIRQVLLLSPLYIKEDGHRMFYYVTQGHRTNKWQNQNIKAGNLPPESLLRPPGQTPPETKVCLTPSLLHPLLCIQTDSSTLKKNWGWHAFYVQSTVQEALEILLKQGKQNICLPWTQSLVKKVTK